MQVIRKKEESKCKMDSDKIQRTPVNEKFSEFKKEAYRDCIKRKGDIN